MKTLKVVLTAVFITISAANFTSSAQIFIGIRPIIPIPMEIRVRPFYPGPGYAYRYPGCYYRGYWDVPMRPGRYARGYRHPRGRRGYWG